MKKIINFIFLFVLSFLLVSNVKAVEYTYRVKIVNPIPLREGAGTNYKSIDSLDLYDYYVMVSDKLYEDTNNKVGCSKGWYNITYYTGVTGYVCADDVEVIESYTTDDATPTSECETKMKEAGFPSSYWGGLCKLQESHPTWSFQAIATDLDWPTVVEKESACGKNYIQTSIYDKTFLDTTCKATSPGNYVAPSQKGVAYYMDPRNFFSEKYMFQFLDQSYDEKLKDMYPEAVLAIISPTNFYKYHKDNNIVDYISGITSASPIAMASKMRNELGNGDSLINLWSGTYEGYEDYYNFYNWGVGDDCVRDHGTTYCGLNKAKELNWKGLKTAIEDGAGSIAVSYIQAGQYTNYFQKFNVMPTDTSKRFTHQYMTNLPGAMSESKLSFSTYKSNDLLGINLIFKIPVYNNMNATIVNSSNGAVESQDNGLGSLDLATLITSSGYSYTSNYLTNVKEESSVESLKNAIEAVGGSGSATILDKNGNPVTSGTLATGYKVTVASANAKETLTIVVKGDTSGDGKINALDLLQVQKSILGTYKLNDEYSLAGDTSGDGKVNALDLLQVQKNILGTYKING